MIDQKISEKRRRQCEKLVEISKDIVKKAFLKFDGKELGVTWTGGKDSGLTLWIIREVCKQENYEIPKTMIIGEGDEFDEIIEFTNKYKIEWKIPLEVCRNEDVINAAGHKIGNVVKVKNLNRRNQEELKRINFNNDEFIFQPESYEGNHLMKTVVFNQWLEKFKIKGVFQGIRWDEHTSRYNDTYFEEKQKSELIPAHTRIKPILHFTEKDLWDTYKAFEIPFCPLYLEGYRSLGAKSTSLKSSNIPAWEQDIENTEERMGRHQEKEKVMDQLRSLGYM